MYDVIYNVIIIIKLNYGWLCIYLSTNTKKKKRDDACEEFISFIIMFYRK
jgi:hypothetical protein